MNKVRVKSLLSEILDWKPGQFDFNLGNFYCILFDLTQVDVSRTVQCYSELPITSWGICECPHLLL